MEQRRDAIVIESEESAMSYYRLRQQIGKLAKEMHRFMVKPKYLLPFLQPGRLVQVRYLICLSAPPGSTFVCIFIGGKSRR